MPRRSKSPGDDTLQHSNSGRSSASSEPVTKRRQLSGNPDTGEKEGVKLDQLPEDIVRHGIGQFLNPDDMEALSLGSRKLYEKAGAPLKDASKILAAIPLDLKAFTETMYNMKKGILYSKDYLNSPQFMRGLAKRLGKTMWRDPRTLQGFDKLFQKKTYILVDCAGPDVLRDAMFVWDVLHLCKYYNEETKNLLLRTMGTNLFSNDVVMDYICQWHTIDYFLQSCAMARDVDFMVKKLDDNNFVTYLASYGPVGLRFRLIGNPIVNDKRFMTKALERLGKEFVLALLDRLLPNPSTLGNDSDFLRLLGAEN